ncbi:MAG: ribosome small subunit-dependent GTPase A [Planctomycetota bacterium]|jgi:ribosome biogenesis GTPase
MKIGVVIRDEGNLVHVDLPGESEPVACVIRKTLRRTTGKRSKAVVVGDRVSVEFSGEGAAVVAVKERRTTLSRPDPLRKHREHIIVANIDAVLIVVSVREPELVPGLIDRFLVAVESRGLEAGIAFNKTDLDPNGVWRNQAALYRRLGYAAIEVSAESGDGLEEVREFLRDKTTSLLGHSGVGKSSLANALDPSLALRVGEVRERSGKGQHTTTTVSLLPLPWGGYLVDTPGIREFGIWNMELNDVAVWFRDLAPFVDSCRFNDCLHEREPNCAVHAALDRGEIQSWRYDSYLRILESMRE